MAEGAGLLNQYTGNCIEGSNPFPSAIYAFARVHSHSLNSLYMLKYKGLSSAYRLRQHLRIRISTLREESEPKSIRLAL